MWRAILGNQRQRTTPNYLDIRSRRSSDRVAICGVADTSGNAAATGR
jgi:hypothetical protein